MSPRTKALGALIAGVLLVSGCAEAQAAPTSAYRAYDGPWLPVVVAEPTPTATVAPEPSYSPTPRPTPRPTPKPSAAPRPPQRGPVAPSGFPRGAVRISGVATWYCDPAWPSPCAAGFGWRGAYAAAGPELRRALGPHWRGRIVWVNGVRVQLIDWCACGGNHVIDVYHLTWRKIPHPDEVTIRW